MELLFLMWPCRFKEDAGDIALLREKEKGDWKKMRDHKLIDKDVIETEVEETSNDLLIK